MSFLFADGPLARELEAAECRFLEDVVSGLRAAPGGEGVFRASVAGGVAAHVGGDSPFNKMIGIGLRGAFGDDDLADLEAVEREHDLRKATLQVEVATLADSSFVQVLTGRGYALVAFENVLGLSLGTPRSEPPVRAELSIAADDVGDASGEAWMDTVVTGFAHPDAVPGGAPHETFPREAIERAMGAMRRASGLRSYVARIDGAVAGAAAVRFDARIAQLCGSATLPELRRRGVQSALLSRRLADAEAAGCRLAVITTQPGSRSQANAQRRGFSLLYARAILVRSPA